MFDTSWLIAVCFCARHMSDCMTTKQASTRRCFFPMQVSTRRVGFVTNRERQLPASLLACVEKTSRRFQQRDARITTKMTMTYDEKAWHDHIHP